jgi:hypothetical protein
MKKSAMVLYLSKPFSQTQTYPTSPAQSHERHILQTFPTTSGRCKFTSIGHLSLSHQVPENATEVKEISDAFVLVQVEICSIPTTR